MNNAIARVPGARVSGAVPAPLDDATIIRALQASKAEAAAGRMAESDQLLARLAQHAPNHPAVLNELGVRMLDRSAAEQAHALFVRATNADPNHPSLWANLASSLKALGRRAEEMDALEGSLAAIRERHGGERQRRVELCLEALMGKRQVFYSQPTWMYFPELPAIEFFERADFPWLDTIEAASDEIRAELLRVLVADRDGLQPYIDFPPDMPLDQFRELNRSRSWSAYFLWNQGAVNAGHIARCPVTARVLEAAPLRPRIEARAPTAFFSILDANTRIPPHTGVTNTRLTVHLPLVVPPGCGFRVGATTREWLPGKAWVFDDTIEHEAWNSSDTPRAILIFDIWNPLLTAAERDLVQTATEIYVRHYALPPEKTA